MACERETISPIINGLQPFSAIKAEKDAAIEAHLNGREQCDLQFVGTQPNPIWPGMKCPDWEGTVAAGNLQMEGLKATISAGITPIIDTAKSVGLEDLIPPLPLLLPFNIQFDALFPIDWEALIAAAEEQEEALTEYVSDVLPDPVFGQTDSPPQSLMVKIGAAINKCMNDMANWFMAVIDLIIGALPIDLGFPVLPTLEEMLSSLYDYLAAAGANTIAAINEFIVDFGFFKFSLGWPDPLYEKTNSPEYDFGEAMSNWVVAFAKAVVDFVTEVWALLVDAVDDAIDPIKVLFEDFAMAAALFPTEMPLPMPITVGVTVA